MSAPTPPDLGTVTLVWVEGPGAGHAITFAATPDEELPVHVPWKACVVSMSGRALYANGDPPWRFPRDGHQRDPGAQGEVVSVRAVIKPGHVLDLLDLPDGPPS